MGAWRSNMPAGMRLKSEPYASDLSAPGTGFLARDYCVRAGEVYPERVKPLSREQFMAYGSWFARQLVPDIEETEVISLSQSPRGGFLLQTANGERHRGNKVVVATGIIPFAYLPPELSGFPSDLVSHTIRARGPWADSAARKSSSSAEGHRRWRRRRCYSSRAQPSRSIVRDEGVSWPAAQPGTIRPACSNSGGRSFGCAKGGPAGAMTGCLTSSGSCPRKPGSRRGLGFLGPAGAWWLRERVEGKVPMLLGHQVLESRR